MKNLFNLQLFADEDMVDAESMGFTEEDLKGFIPEKEDAPPEPVAEPAETTEEPSETAPVSDDKETVTEDHSENLKAALKEERARRKALRDELEALKAQKETAPIQQPQTPTQAPDVVKQIKADARAKAIKSLEIEGNPSDLMFADPEKYEEFVSERARLEYEAIHSYKQQQQTFQQNVNFVNELRNTPDFPVILNYAMQELDEMPRKQSRAIEDAYNRVDAGRGNTEDFNVLRKFVSECQGKLGNGNGSEQQFDASQANSGGLTSKLEQAANLPKASQLAGGKTTQVSWAEVERLAAAGKFDEIPKEMLLKLDPTGELLK